MLDQFSRTELLLGTQAMATLEQSRVAVFGLGGVGSHAAEALARTGIGALDLIDHDRVNPTNLNRQCIATLSTVGRPKAEVMAERIADINPNCAVQARQCFYLPASASQFDFTEYDYVIDAVDTVTGKLLLIAEANRCNTPIISSMGTANKLDPTAFEVADIYETSICPLAKIIRKECRKRGVKSLKVVYSKEPAMHLSDEAQASCRESSARAGDEPPTVERRSGIPGSTAFVPPVAGLIIAGEVVKDLIGIRR